MREYVTNIMNLSCKEQCQIECLNKCPKIWVSFSHVYDYFSDTRSMTYTEFTVLFALTGNDVFIHERTYYNF